MTEEWGPAGELVEPPRATLLVAASEVRGLQADIWMGGARSHLGEDVHGPSVERGIFLDLAGDLPPTYREEAHTLRSFVFADIDAMPPRFERLVEVVEELHEAVTCAGERTAAGLYLMCTHGMNRSGLASGLVMRRLGFSGEEAIKRITSRRLGALSNQTYRRLILET